MIAVVGATGFVGRSVMELLAAGDEPVRALYRKGKPDGAAGQSKNITRVEGDLTDPASLKTLLEGADKVINMGAVTANLKNVNNLYYRVNVEGTRNLVKAAGEAGVKRFVMVSGLGTQPSKPGSYLQLSWEREEILRSSGLDFTILQYSILFGKGAEFFEAQAKIIKMAPFAAVLGNGKTRFQPIFVKDVARTIVEALGREDLKGKTVALGGPEFFTYDELISLIIKNLGKTRFKLHLPLPIARVQAKTFNLLPKPPLTPATVDLFDFENTTSDVQVVEHTFGFKPRDLKGYLEENKILS